MTRRPALAALTSLPALVLSAALAFGLSACTPDDPDFTYVAIGASDAVGLGAQPLRKGYVWRIRDGLEEKGAKVALRNLSLPAAEASRLGGVLQGRLADGGSPSLVTLWVGGNDLIMGRGVDSFERDLARLLEQVKDSGAQLVVLANLPDLTRLARFQGPGQANVTPERVTAFNAAISRQADAFALPLVDLQGEDWSAYMAADHDGFHPLAEGHERVADAFLGVLRERLGLAEAQEPIRN